MKLYRALRAFSILVFFLIVLGGTVRNLGAGLSCPDWPLCYGKIIPPFDPRIFAEYFHRLVAALVSTLTLILAFVIFRNPRYRSVLRGNMIFAICLLAVQVVLGGLTVLQLLKSEIVTLHLTAGTLFLATAILMTLKTKYILSDAVGAETSLRRGAEINPASSESNPHQTNKDDATSQLTSWSTVALVALFLQIILGGMVSSHFAGLACPDFPKCLGMWWPGFIGIAGIHFTHRLGALLVTLIVLSFVIKSLTTKNLIPDLKWKIYGILILLLTQVGLGISNVIFHLPVLVSVGHLAVAEALFGLILVSTYEIRNFQLR